MSEGESTGKFTDASDPIFTMYNETAGEEDRKMAESWKADADRILIFVSYITQYITLGNHLSANHGHRLVCSPLHLQLWLRSRYRTFGRIHRIGLHFISRISTSFLPTPTPIFQSLRHSPNHLGSLRLDMQSGSIRSGS